MQITLGLISILALLLLAVPAASGANILTKEWRADIGSSSYPVPVHMQPAFADLGYKPGSFPVAEALVAKIISLPMFPELADNQIERVAKPCLKD